MEEQKPKHHLETILEPVRPKLSATFKAANPVGNVKPALSVSGFIFCADVLTCASNIETNKLEKTKN